MNSSFRGTLSHSFELLFEFFRLIFHVLMDFPGASSTWNWVRARTITPLVESLEARKRLRLNEITGVRVKGTVASDKSRKGSRDVRDQEHMNGKEAVAEIESFSSGGEQQGVKWRNVFARRDSRDGAAILGARGLDV
jgi:hypothetical protein